MGFIRENDYKGQVKAEIKKLLTGTDSNPTIEQTNAEAAAVAQIRQYLGKKYDCDAILAEWDGTGTDPRNAFIVGLAVDITLYKLYKQTGMKDIPTHRKEAYDDAVMWLRDVGLGDLHADLPRPADENFSGFFRVNSRKPTNHKW